MLGLDTHVLVRFLVRDDPRHYRRARRIISDEVKRGGLVFVSQLVLLETEWVLRSRYEYSKDELMGVLVGMLESADLMIEDESSLEQAVFVWRDSGAEFADCLISARHQSLGCQATATFDVKAAKLPGFISA